MKGRRTAAAHSVQYEIRVAGRMDPGWSDWLPGMRIGFGEDDDLETETVLRGFVPDQSALRGILCKLWDLGLTVDRVSRLPVDGQERG